MRVPLTAGLWSSVLVALAIWLPGLGERPFHNDEAVNALIFRGLWEEGSYRYDPEEYHGPTLHYATLCLAKAMGWGAFADTTEADFRLVPVLAGVSLILLLALVADGLGRMGTVWGGVMIALSPVVAYFSRSYIHETLLVSASFLLLACAWRYWQKPHWAWAVLAGVALGLMQATKETFVINLAALVGAGVICRLWCGLEAGQKARQSRCSWLHAVLAVLAWLTIWVVLFSSFFSNAAGPVDSLRTYAVWLGRAGGDSPHMHSGSFYLERLFWFQRGSGPVWTELGLLALASVAMVACIRRKGLNEAQVSLVRVLAIYGLIQFAIYSCIPYKTPWCILGAVHALAVLAGVGLAVLWQIAWRSGQRVVLVAVLAVMLAHLGWQAWILTHDLATNRRNPWAYAATSMDVRNLVELLNELTRLEPDGFNTPIQIACVEGEYWPLPYLLRQFPHTGWYAELPPGPHAPVLIVSPALEGESELSSRHESAGTFQLRAGVFLRCFVDRDLWTRLVQSREPR